MSQTTTITLLTGDYADRLAEAFDAVQHALKAEERQDSDSLLAGEEPDSVRLTRAYNDLNAEAKKASAKAKRDVTLRAIGRSTWRQLKEKHPIRTEGDPEVVKGDRIAGVNTDTVEDDLVYASISVPKFTSREAYDEWADDLSIGEFNTVLRAAWSLANVAQHAPKSLPVSPTQKSGGNSV